MEKKSEQIKLQLKKKLALLTLGSMFVTSSITGCGSNTKTNTSEMTTTEVTSLEKIDDESSVYQEVANASYNKYKEFYDSINVSEQNIETLTKILNSDFDNIHPDDVDSSYALVNQMILSDNMMLNINSSFFGNDADKKVYAQPRVSELVSNDNVELKEFMIRIENLREEVYIAYTTGTEEDRQLANQNAAKLVDYEAIQYRKNNSIMNNQFLTRSTRILASEYEKNLIAIFNLVSVNQPEMESTEGFTIYLISNVTANVDEEGNVVYDYTGTDDVAFSDGEKLRKLLAQSEQGKYIETSCSELALLKKDVYERTQGSSSKTYSYSN